ncbi:T-box protein VegT [Exaiptasia diaphana]|nr:T-box protein VegT [Exaiptasia diaphana]
MKEGARFDKVKLSNHHKQFSDFIILTSLQKYRAQLVMTKIGVPQCERWIFDFPETAFIAVTCYQNPSITKLKIDYNPFAKAFRQGKRPAKRPESVKPKVASSSQRSKRPRIHLSSPPPVTRLQPPPLGHFPEEAPRRASSPPPPPPPLNLYSCQSLPTRDMLQEEMAMQRYVE